MDPIHIKASHKGRFTAWAKAHGFGSVSEAASAVLANKGKYSPEVVKMANFDHNAKGLNHSTPATSTLMGS